MRSLDECKAEIFRRSEIKIKQRKKTRNRILAACIPLCLCIGIGTVGFAAGGFGAKSDNMAAAPESAGWNNNGFGLMDAETFLEENICVSGNTSAHLPGAPQESEDPQYSDRPLAGITPELTVTAESENYDALKEILLELDYSPHKVCRCLPQYRLKTDFGEFGIHLTEGYARCEAGQAKLTAEQIRTLRQIIDALTVDQANE